MKYDTDITGILSSLKGSYLMKPRQSFATWDDKGQWLNFLQYSMHGRQNISSSNFLFPLLQDFIYFEDNDW